MAALTVLGLISIFLELMVGFASHDGLKKKVSILHVVHNMH